MISFIIPVYNSERTIATCLLSVLNQNTDIKYEILVIDDGSTDLTKKIVKEFSNNYSCVRYIYKKNAGVASARNLGISLSNGEYLIFIDSDDFVENNFFNDIVGYDKYDLTIFEFNKSNVNNLLHFYSNNEKKDIFSYLFNNKLFNPVWNKIYKKSKIKQLFSEDMVMAEDLVFNIFYFNNINNINIINKKLYNYCVENSSITTKYNYLYFLDFLKAYRLLLDLENNLKSDCLQKINQDYVNNISGNLQLLINNIKSYKETINEMKMAQKIIEYVKVNDFSFNNLIYELYNKKFYFFIFVLVKGKRFLKYLMVFIIDKIDFLMRFKNRNKV